MIIEIPTPHVLQMGNLNLHLKNHYIFMSMNTPSPLGICGYQKIHRIHTSNQKYLRISSHEESGCQIGIPTLVHETPTKTYTKERVFTFAYSYCCNKTPLFMNKSSRVVSKTPSVLTTSLLWASAGKLH